MNSFKKNVLLFVAYTIISNLPFYLFGFVLLKAYRGPHSPCVPFGLVFGGRGSARGSYSIV